MEAATTAAEPTPAVSGPAVREAVLGGKFTVLWLGGFVLATVVATVSVMAFIDSRMEDKMTLVRQDMERFRSDVKEGFRDLKDEVRLLRDAKK